LILDPDSRRKPKAAEQAPFYNIKNPSNKPRSTTSRTRARSPALQTQEPP
jgi:hypothetical protein